MQFILWISLVLFICKPGIAFEDFHGLNKTECPGSTQSCADGYTCCMSPAGTFACCPIQNAICCEDKIHCCPQGTTCDTKAGKCNKTHSLLQTSLLEDVDSNGSNVNCSDEFQCPDRFTCCRLTGGTFGCCPLENAVCCSDNLHCCPSGFTCTTEGLCVKSAT